MTQKELNKVLASHSEWLKNNAGDRANLRGANLRGANLRGADLYGANLRRADLDFSSFPLWCGSFGMKTDINLVYQLLYHICRLGCSGPEFEEIKSKIIGYANKSHIINKHGVPEL